jgi:membrane protease YdiL (CAAX protease family)
MLRSFLSKPAAVKPWMALGIPVWVIAGFLLAQVVAGLLLAGLNLVGVSFDGLNESTLQTVISAIIYIISLTIVIGLPWWVKRYRTTRKELGLEGSFTWLDILLTPFAFGFYAVLSAILTAVAIHFPFYDAQQVQDTGFTQLTHGYEYVLAFLTLVIIAPVAEETLFRGYLLGKLRKYVATWIAILITSVVFGILHFAWNVGVDVFALSIVLCILRVVSGRLWPSILLHMVKNGFAFYILFINPLL